MKRPSPPSRRILTLFAATTAAVLAMASPAAACTATVKAKTLGCGPTAGTWQVRWHITNDVTEAHFLVFDQSFSAPILDVKTNKPITKDTPLPDAYADKAGLIGVQTIPDTVKSVSLTIQVAWPGEGPNGTTFTGALQEPVSAYIPQGECGGKPPVSPSASPAPSTSASSPAVHNSSPAAGGGGGSGSGLPVTGVNSLAFGGVALALIGGGAVLVLLGRRRRDGTSS